jgi:glutathione S-transferase
MTPRSPFARRIRLALARHAIPFIEKETNVFEPKPEFLEANPLALVPVLELSDGTQIPDSSTILDYIDENLAPIYPKDPAARTRARILSTYAAGIMTCTVSHYLERIRTLPAEDWLTEQHENIERALKYLNTIWSPLDSITQAGWDIAVALEYLDLRLPDRARPERYLKLHSVLQEFGKQDVFKKTTPPPA